MWDRMRSHRAFVELRREENGRRKLEASKVGVIRIWEEYCNWSGDGRHLKEAKMSQRQ